MAILLWLTTMGDIRDSSAGTMNQRFASPQGEIERPSETKKPGLYEPGSSIEQYVPVSVR
jgi:hypothetical protein